MKFIIYRTSDRYKPYHSPTKKTKKVKIENSFYYEIEINTMDDLMTLTENVGEIIIHNKNIFYEVPAIEIYDTYRE